jgi:DNA polymerase elongation subunit (family B)
MTMSKFYTNAFLFHDSIFLRGFEEGRRVMKTIPCKPYVFVNSKRPNAEFKTLKGQPVDKLQFDRPAEARDFLRQYENVSGFEVYGMTQWLYPFLNDYYPGEIDYDPKMVSVVNIDIEVAADDGFPDVHVADKPITAITVKKNDIYVVLGCGDFVTNDDKIKYLKCENEERLLLKFLDVWRSEWLSPDVITGWNIDKFDIPYIVNRIRRVLGHEMHKKLSPWGMVEEREIIRGKSAARGGNGIDDRKDVVYEIYGITSLDYLETYKKFSFKNQESYRLDYIGEVELGVKKLDYSEHGSLLELYKQDYQKFIEYNIRDVEIVSKLDDKLKLIEQVFAIAYDAKVNFSDAYGSVRIWDVIIHNYLINQRVVIPQKRPSHKDKQIIGGYVKDPLLGMHDWVVSFDLNSLYPHLIMQYNISPETYAGKLPLSEETSVQRILDGYLDELHVRNEMTARNLTVTGSGVMFERDKQGFLPKLMEKMYEDRVVYKKRMLEAEQQYQKTPTPELEKVIAQNKNMQLARKIQLNSAYGALSNKYFRWYDDTLAESITLSGQLAIMWIARDMNKYLNKLFTTKDADYVIACDTDSMYITLGKLVSKCGLEGSPTSEIVKFLDNAIESKIEPFIESSYGRLGGMVNAYAQKMKMKREAIADKGIWTAKKHYILNIWNNEGVAYAEPKVKVVGIEAVRSSTPQACREKIKQCLKVIMGKTEDDVIKFIAQFRDEFVKMSYEEVAFPRGCKGLSEYADRDSIYKKGTPIQVRGALLYNHHVKQKKLSTKYELIKEGDKIKFCYMKLPNPIRENVVASLGALPPELGLETYIDYELQYSKAFVEPLKTILDAIGWRTEKKASIESFF